MARRGRQRFVEVLTHVGVKRDHLVNGHGGLLDDRLAAGDGDGGPGHIARLVGSEHYIGRREFLGLRRSPERRVLAELLHLVWRHGGRNERGPDRPGSSEERRVGKGCVSTVRSRW